MPDMRWIPSRERPAFAGFSRTPEETRTSTFGIAPGVAACRATRPPSRSRRSDVSTRRARPGRRTARFQRAPAQAWRRSAISRPRCWHSSNWIVSAEARWPCLGARPAQAQGASTCMSAAAEPVSTVRPTELCAWVRVCAPRAAC